MIFAVLSAIFDYMDSDTTIQQLKDFLLKFREERDWTKFHNPKDLAIAASVEMGEFLEKFIWKDKAEVILKLKEDLQYRKEVGDELVDVIIYCLQFADTNGIDVSEAFYRKMGENAGKYPVEKVKGRAEKYSSYE